MRASTAYFAGAGTVIAAIVAGLGGGLLFADIVSPKSPKQEMTRLEQRMSPQPIQAIAGPAEPAPNVAAPAQPQAQGEAAQTAPAAALSAETAATAQPALPVARSEPSPSQPVVQKQAAGAPEDAVARVRDVDIKRAIADKRRTERRQQWSERRRNVQRQDHELLQVEEKVREETEPRRIFASERARAEMPQIRLFGLD